MPQVLELNDTSLTFSCSNGLTTTSIGVAYFEKDDEVIFGEAALRQSRLHPRGAVLDYFHRLNADPLPNPQGRYQNHADLLYGHLNSLVRDLEALSVELPTNEDTIVVVPGSYSADQLGLLLGVCQEANIKIGAFIDTAVVELANENLAANANHLDIQLQQGCLTRINADTNVSRRDSQSLVEIGLLALVNSWVNVVADRFIDTTRFDPLKIAASEQQVFDQVYAWLVGDQAEEIGIEVEHGGSIRRVDISAKLLADKSIQRFANLRNILDKDSQVFLSPRLATIPGLTQVFSQWGIDTQTIAVEAARNACEQHAAHILDRSGVRLVTSLPCKEVTATQATNTLQPTHLLIANQATPLANFSASTTTGFGFQLDETQCNIIIDNGGQVLLNDEVVVGETMVSLGDRISSRGQSYHLIRVNKE